MRRSFVLMSSLCVAAAAAAPFAPRLLSQDEPPAAGADPLAAYEAASAPVAEHKALARFEGDWSVRSKFFLEPGAPPHEEKGKSEFKLLFGGRYLREKYESQFRGKPFEGLGMTGYDRTKGALVCNWVDSMSTGFCLSEGTISADGGVLELKGAVKDPISGEEIRFRWTKTWSGDDQFTFAAYESRAGQPERLHMEHAYKRKKKP